MRKFLASLFAAVSFSGVAFAQTWAGPIQVMQQNSGGLIVGITTIASGNSGYIEYNNGAVLGEKATNGSGNVVLATSPTLVTPTLGVAAGTSLALGGATIGTDALAATGTAAISGVTSVGALNLTSTTVPSTGFFFDSSSFVGVAWGGVGKMKFTSASLTSDTAAGGAFLYQAATTTAPSYIPNSNDLKAGIGADASGDVSIIGDNAGTATEVIRVTGTAAAIETITTGTNADFACFSATHTFLEQTTACTISSRRFKQDIQPFGGAALGELMKLPVDTFRLKATKPANRDPNARSLQIGLIAEDIAKIEPRCAIYENDMKTPKSYRQECVIALLVRGMQEQQAEIVQLQSFNCKTGCVTTKGSPP